MSFMFNGCSDLQRIPDISKWETNQIKDISYLFNECSLLTSLPDISKWNTNQVINLSFLLNDKICKYLN